ncbi:MAG: 50S ribosome-binding GTPase [Candidatus Poribacteria bacterium]|nr:50S ribosome-binding GTPase [Candidatus Poribacteria bacterium]
MPANLPPTYYKLKHQHEAAKTDEERLGLLEEMLRIIPKHKGSEKVVSDLRRRIARYKKDPSEKGGKGSGKRSHSEHIPKQGAGQIVLFGPPNAGKSHILANFTNAKPEVSPTPYTTTIPTVGMLQYENIQFQIIDTPSIMLDFVSSTVLTLTRNADLVLPVVSLASDNLLDDLDMVVAFLDEADCDTLDAKPVIVANQLDATGAEERLEILKEFYGEAFQIYPISAETGVGKDALLPEIYSALDILRVYLKAPGKAVERDDPIVLPTGSTILDAAIGLHKDFAEFKFARIWGPQWHDGQSVSRNDVVYDGDVVEFHL